MAEIAPNSQLPDIEKRIAELDASAAERQGALDKETVQAAEANKAATEPLEKQQEAGLHDLTEFAGKYPKQPDLPQPPSKPLIDAKQYEGLSWGLLAMAMIGGIASKGDWMGVSASLNGALKGYLEGNQQRAQKEFEDYKTKFNAAMAKHNSEVEEYENILSSKKLTINEISQRIENIARKYNRETMLQAAKQKSIDTMVRQADSLRSTSAGLEEKHNAVQAGLDKAADKAKATSEGVGELGEGLVGQVEAGMPRAQVVGGMGNAGVKTWVSLEQRAIKSIATDLGLSEKEAGIELARRQADYSASKSSMLQIQKALGAARGAVGQLDKNVALATQTLGTMEGSDLSPIVNAIIRGEQKWTGDPKYSELFVYMNAIANEAAKLQAGGAASAAQVAEGARIEAMKWANTDMTPKSLTEGTFPAILSEGRARLSSFEEAYKAQRGAVGNPNPAPAPSAHAFEDPEKERRYQEWKKTHAQP